MAQQLLQHLTSVCASTGCVGVLVGWWRSCCDTPKGPEAQRTEAGSQSCGGVSHACCRAVLCAGGAGDGAAEKDPRAQGSQAGSSSLKQGLWGGSKEVRGLLGF